MEDKVVLLDNGREVEAEDINTLGDVSALADDHVLAELFRMSVSGVAKGILPYAMNGTMDKAIIQPDVTARTFIVNPFRAFVGIRADASGDGKKLWRDIRSAISPTGSTIARSVSVAENTSGDPRWDLIYAVLAVDTNVSQTRYFKDPSSEIVSAGSYVTKKRTTLSIAVAQGDPAGSPAKPALPADSGGNYNVPLAYVLVVNGATAMSEANVLDAAPVLALAPSTSAQVVRPASYCSTTGGALLTHQPWDLSGVWRPRLWLPPSMAGGVSIIIPISHDAIRTPISLAHGDVIDDKIDWRKRYFRYFMQTGSTSEDLGSDPQADWTNQVLPSPWFWNAYIPGGFDEQKPAVVVGMSQSFIGGLGNISAGIDVAVITKTLGASFGGEDTVKMVIYVDVGTGALKFHVSGGTPVTRTTFVWLDATAQFTNAGA